VFIYPAPLRRTAEALRTGQLDLSTFLDDLCDRIGRTEPFIQALVPERDRRARLQQEAQALQASSPDPSRRPPLYGVPVGIKDIVRVDGFPTRAGSRLPPHLFDGPEAAVVAALRRAGALILGKTVTTEFAYFQPGPTRNPHHPDHTPGGSSSGSAAAVAAGYCPLALGTQTIGSVIRPAAFCGIVGFKPTRDRISPTGLIPFSPSADQVGLFTQDVGGMTLVAAILCRGWESILASQYSTLPMLGVPEGPYLQQASPATLAIFEEQLAGLAAAGCVIRRVTALEEIDGIARHHHDMIAAEAAEIHAEWFQTYEPLYGPHMAAIIRAGREVSPQALAAARDGRESLRLELARVMNAAGIDLWVTPAAPGPAPRGLTTTGSPAMNLPWTYAGMPALSLPAGCTKNGLPLGLQLVARFEADEQLLAWAESLALVFPHRADSVPSK